MPASKAPGMGRTAETAGRGRSSCLSTSEYQTVRDNTGMSFPDLYGTSLAAHVIKVMIAYALGLPTGWERFKHDRSAGLRTFPLVSLASCAYLLAAEQGSLPADTKARILVGVMTGIGFIGGGSILKEAASVHGTATAASL